MESLQLSHRAIVRLAWAVAKDQGQDPVWDNYDRLSAEADYAKTKAAELYARAEAAANAGLHTYQQDLATEGLRWSEAAQRCANSLTASGRLAGIVRINQKKGWNSRRTIRRKEWHTARAEWLRSRHLDRVIELAADKETARRSAGFYGFEECRELLDKGWTIDLRAGQNGGATYSKPKWKNQ